MGPCLETELLEGLHNDIMCSLMNWPGRRVEINLLATKCVAQNTVRVAVFWGICGHPVRRKSMT